MYSSHDVAPDGPWPELVEVLTEKLEQARRGEITAFACCVETRSGDCDTFALHNVGSSAYKMVGSLDVLKHSIINRHLVPRDD